METVFTIIIIAFLGFILIKQVIYFVRAVKEKVQQRKDNNLTKEEDK